jgi:hypothetical protein
MNASLHEYAAYFEYGNSATGAWTCTCPHPADQHWA